MAIDRFLNAAEEYCRWVEGDPIDPTADVFSAILRLSELYTCTLMLPDINVATLPPLDRVKDLSVETIVRLRRRFGNFPFQYYWEVFHAVTLQPAEPVCGDITDDLLEIYKDVKEGLITYQNGDQSLAVWYWQNCLGLHWGRHALSALKALHDYEPPDE